MTAKEAKSLENDSDIQKIEKDVTVKALETEETTGVKIQGSTAYTSTDKLSKEDKGKEPFWNLKSIHANHKQGNSKRRVKVALLDSGVDFQENLKIKERVNLIAEEEEFSAVFEDESCHGTSIASLIVGTGNKVKGINDNVDLYSARILDGNKKAPVSRVIEGIYWAIDKKVNIINISFGTNQYSEALKQAIDDANAKGILVIAAAGNQGENGTDNVEYPAAFKNVVAVGSINSKAEASSFSSNGKEVDIVAPGEAIRATGAFGETMVTSGTSMAVPHVVGVASRLWQKDLSKSNTFIRQLLQESARPLGETRKYGCGLIDCKYAEDMYNKAEQQYVQKNEIDLKTNTRNIESYDNSIDETKVEGTWTGTNHQKYLTDKGVNLSAMKSGAVYPDKEESKVNGMDNNPDFHGYYHSVNDGNERVNYLASYRFMIKIGNAYGKGKTYTAVAQSDIPGLTKRSYNAIRAAFSRMNSKIKSYKSTDNRKAFVFGIAMHTATDAFAHSTFRYTNGKWSRITHNPKSNPPADNVNVQPRRFTMAYRIERNTLYRYKEKRKDVPVCHDFHAAGDTNGTYYTNDSGNKYYRIANISKNAAEVHIKDTNVIKHYKMLNVDPKDVKN